MPLEHDEKVKYKRTYYLYTKACECGEHYGPCLDFYKDGKPIDWKISRTDLDKLTVEYILLCLNCWAKKYKKY